MRVVGYVRVSTIGQAQDGLGLPIQEKAIRQWAKANSHRVVAVTRDEGISGANGIEGRLGLHDALHLIATGKAKGLVVHKLDRLARDLLVQETTLAQVWNVGGSVFSVEQGEILEDDVSDPMATAFRQMVGVFSQLERGMIAARLRAGRRHKAQAGGYTGGAPPFGYRAEGRELVPDPQEQAVLAHITELRQVEGLSLRGIAQQLTDEGHRPKRGERWHPETLRLILDKQPGKG